MCAIAVALSFTACGPDGGDTEPDSVTRADDRANQPKNHPPKNQPQRQQGATVVDPEVLARGRVAWRACAKCHCASDPRIAQDTDWVCLNETTACIAQGKPAPGLRAAILAYLNHADTLRPILVGRDALTDDPAKLGKIAVPAEAGSAYLKAERPSIRRGSPAMVRIRWEKTDEEKYVTAPAGTYNVINFWHYRAGGAAADERWMVSGTNVNGAQTLEIDPEAPEFLELEPVLNARFSAKHDGSVYTLTLSIHDVAGTRMTVSCNGRLSIPRYRIRAANGDVIAEGPFVPT